MDKNSIVKARLFLEEEGKKIKRLNNFKKDLEILKKDIEGRRKKGNLGGSTSFNISGIDTLILSREKEKENIESKIEELESDRLRLENLLDNLDDTQRDILEVRYIKNKKYNKPTSFDDISLELNISVSTVKRQEKQALEEIAYYKDGFNMN